MKPTRLFPLLLAATFFSCDKSQDAPGIEAISYNSSFSVETRPTAIEIDPDKECLYVLNQDSHSSKIQKFSLKGTLKETIIDFDFFSDGLFDGYSPLDMCIDKSEIYVLVKPMTLSDEQWTTLTGFCILHFGSNGSLISELDFSQSEGYWNHTAMSYFNDCLYVTSGEIVIKKINVSTGKIDDILIPITNDRSYFPVSDMVVDSEEEIYLTGQGPWRIDSQNDDVSICYISRLDVIENDDQIFFSSSRTGVMAAMLNRPGMTIKDHSYIYLTTFYGRSLEIYNEDNELIFQEEIKPGELEETLPVDVALNGVDIYIADYENSMVHIYREE